MAADAGWLGSDARVLPEDRSRHAGIYHDERPPSGRVDHLHIHGDDDHHRVRWVHNDHNRAEYVHGAGRVDDHIDHIDYIDDVDDLGADRRVNDVDVESHHSPGPVAPLLALGAG
jgi:hypothetical protein